MCHHTRCAAVRWLIVMIYCPSGHLVCRTVSDVRVSASFQIIPHPVPVGRLVVRGSVSIHRVLHVFYRPVCRPMCQKGHFLPLLSCHVLGRPHNDAVVRRCVFSTEYGTLSVYTVDLCQIVCQ